MHKWWKQFKLENRFIYRNWFFLIAPFAFGAFILLIFAIESPVITNPHLVDATNQYLSMMNSYQVMIHTLTLGVIMLLAVLNMRRHYNKTAYAINGAWPVSQTTILSAIYIAGFLYASIFTVIMSAVFWFLALFLDVNMTAAANALAFYVLHYEWSYGVTLALAMFLAAVIPGRIVYLIAFCGWMFGTFFLDQFIIFRYHLYFLKTFHLSQFFMTGIWHSLIQDSVWGLDIIRREIWFSRLFVFAFAGALFVTMVLILKKKRPTRSLKKWGVLSTIVLLFTAASATPYFTMWGERYAAHNAHAADAVPFTVVHPEEAVDEDLQKQRVKKHPIYKFPVSDYIIEARKTADDKLAVQAQMTIPSTVLQQHNPLTFTLNRSFAVETLMVNGQSVDFKRKDDYVTITDVPDHTDQLTFQFQYEGIIGEWSPGRYGEKYYAFMKDDSLLIPSYIGWYPLPGKQPLYVNEGGAVHMNSSAGLMEKGANFTVELKDFNNQVFTSIHPEKRKGDTQIFTAEDARGVSLVAGNLSKIADPDNGVVLIGPSRHAYEMKQMLDGTTEMLTYYRDWLNLPNETTKLFFLRLNIFLNNGWLHLDSSFISDTFDVNNIYRDEKDEFPTRDIGRAFKNAILYGSYRDYSPLDIRGKILELIDEMYNIEKNGGNFPKTFYDDFPKDFKEKHRENIATNHKITDMVNQAVNEGHIDQVKQVLEYFYNNGITGENGTRQSEEITFQDWQRKWDQVMDNE